jgi:hypothetical protein
MSTKNKIRLRLRADHLRNGVMKKKGTVIKVGKFEADFLIQLNRAALLR